MCPSLPVRLVPRAISQTSPTKVPAEEVKVRGLSQARVVAGESSVLERMERPRA